MKLMTSEAALRLVPAAEPANTAADVLFFGVGDSAVINNVYPKVAAGTVAKACAANPIALAVPCHRVIRTDGELAGYRWGIERKRDLIEKEARA